MRNVSLLREGALDHFVEPLGTGQIASEGLFHDHPRPAAGLGRVETALAQIFQNDRELVRAGGQVVEAVATCSALGVQLLEAFGKGSIALQIVELASVIEDRRSKPRPQFLFDALARKVSRGFFEFFPEDLVVLVPAREADDAHGGREGAIGGKIVNCWDELTMSQVSRCAENDDGARLWHRAARETLAKRIDLLDLRHWLSIARSAEIMPIAEG